MKTSIANLGSLYVHGYSFAKGEINEGHSHTYDHVTLLSRGSIAIESNGKRTEFVSSNIQPFVLIPIPKGVQHRIIALEDFTVLACLHALHSKDNPGDILDPTVVPAGTPPWSFTVPLLEGAAREQGFTADQTKIPK